MSAQAAPEALTDAEIDAICAPGRAQRWRNDGRQYDRDTARLIERALLDRAALVEAAGGLEAWRAQVERENEVRSEVLALIREEHPNPTEHECFSAEAAGQFGFEMVDDNGEWLMGRAPHFGALLDHVAKNALAAQPPQAAQPEVEREALVDAVANLAGAASAYRTYAKRHSSQGKAETDAFFSTRANDFDIAVERGRAALAASAHEERKSEGTVRHLIRRVTDCIDSDVVVTKTLLQNVVTYLRQHPSLVQPEAPQQEVKTFAEATTHLKAGRDVRVPPEHVEAFKRGLLGLPQPEAQELPALPEPTWPRNIGLSSWTKEEVCAYAQAYGDARTRAAIAQERERQRARLEPLVHAGAMLSNCAFNLAQRDHLTKQERTSLDESRKAWDEAVFNNPLRAALKADGQEAKP